LLLCRHDPLPALPREPLADRGAAVPRRPELDAVRLAAPLDDLRADPERRFSGAVVGAAGVSADVAAWADRAAPRAVAAMTPPARSAPARPYTVAVRAALRTRGDKAAAVAATAATVSCSMNAILSTFRSNGFGDCPASYTAAKDGDR
jgi:hypothetical protein